MSRKKLKRTILNLLVLVCIGVVAYYSYQFYTKYKTYHHADEVAEEIQEIVNPEQEPEESWTPSAATYTDMKAINEDYFGWLLFDSSLISEPILQGYSNDTYLRRDIYGNYDVFGSIFIDAENVREDANYVIYGHSWTGHKNNTQKFSQLQNMTEQAFYEANQTFKIYYQDHADSYQIVSCYIWRVDSEDYRFNQLRFDTKEQQIAWLQEALQKSEIQSDYEIDYDSDIQIVTMQTCVDDWSTLRYVVTAVKTGTEPLQ